MSADAAAMACPVCSGAGTFGTVQALKDRLIFVSTNKIACPVCREEVVGLDKLTIHLFSHVTVAAILEDNARRVDAERKPSRPTRRGGKQRETFPKNNGRAAAPPAAAPVKFVKIYPKLPAIALNTTPLINSGILNSCTSTTLPTNSDMDENRCNICGVQFISEDILKMHNSIIHDVEERSAAPTEYGCHLCAKRFKMRGSLMVHLRVAHFGFAQRLPHHGVEASPKADEDGDDADAAAPGCPRSDGKQWRCDVCNKYFTTKYFLKKHKRLHTGETPYSCSQCNKTFTFQQSYHKHLLYHNDDKPHACSHCGRAFKELSTLHNHQRIHTGEKPFACETCGKCFRQRVSYLVHRRIHTGAMPYKCTACDKSFRYKVSQRTHKCPSQPPGAVVRKSDDFVATLSKPKRSPNQKYEDHEDQFPNFSEISQVNAELIRTGAQLSLEDMESEHFSIIPEGVGDDFFGCAAIGSGARDRRKDDRLSTEMFQELIDSVPGLDESVPSPSDILKNLCLSNEYS